MSEEETHDLFKPFFRSHNSISQNLNPSGYGVGLSICKLICESLDGSISVHSKPGKGSKFTFTMRVFTILKDESDDPSSIDSSEG